MQNQNLHTYVDTPQTAALADAPIVLMQWNVDDAVREEQFEQSRWANRVNRILAYIALVRPAILCLEEVTQRAHRTQLIAGLSALGYDSAYGRRNSTPGATSNLVAWDASRFYLCWTENVQLLGEPEGDRDIRTLPADNANPAGWGCNLFVARLAECAPPEMGGRLWVPPRMLTVGAAHFPVHIPSRNASFDALAQWIASQPDGDWIAAGDLNAFEGQGGSQQVAKIAAAALDVGGTVVGEEGMSDQSGTPIHGTFFGFDHDRFRFPLGGPLDPLDYVAVGPAFDVEQVEIGTRSMLVPEPPEFSTTSLPSDHLPVIVTIARRPSLQ